MQNHDIGGMWHTVSQKAVSTLKKMREIGFYDIFLTSVLVKMVGMVGNMLLARILSKSDYGIYAYVLNAYSILILLGDMGTNVTAVQMCSESHLSPERQAAWFSWLFRLGMRIILVSCALVLFSGFYYPFQSDDMAFYTASLFLLPLLQNVNRFILTNARSKLENRIYAKINLFSSIIHWFALLPMSYLFSFRGAIYSDYVIQFLIMLFGLYKSRGILVFRAPQGCLTKVDKHTAIRLSVSCGLSNIINNSLGLVDVFFLGLLIKDVSVIASYKIAVNIPAALAFIPSAIDTVLLPRFARIQDDPRQVFRIYGKVIIAVCCFNLFLCAGTFLFGSQVMTLIYGAQYEDAAACFFILMLGYFFSSIRAISYGVLYSQRQVGINLFVVAFSAVANLILNAILIPAYGSIGAAVASASINLLAAFMMVGYLIWFLRIRAPKLHSSDQ